MLKVLFVAAEAVPFAKTGGLGDVIGTLPKELRKQGVDARVMIPRYEGIAGNFKEQMEVKAEFIVPVGWRHQYCGVQYLEHQNVPFYFIDNEDYFKRPGFYGYYDDGERFTFFCRAVLQALPEIEFKPDIIHCHDWHTGMVSVFLKAHYWAQEFYQDIHTLFTIHNLRYQGIFPKEIVPDLLALDWEYFNNGGIEFYDKVSFMKGGLVFSDLISTVSKTYAEEIQYPFYGEQLDGLLRHRQDALVGIVNGIDYEEYNPATDEKIPVKYSVNSLELKRENKEKLQERLGLSVRDDVPLIGIVSRLVGPKGLDLVERVLYEMLTFDDMQFVVLGTGEWKYEHLFQHAAWQYPDRVSANIYFDDALARQIYAGADMFLMPSQYEPCGIGQLIAMRYGSVPIVRETGGLKDTIKSYNQITGNGNGLSFANYNAHDMMHTIRSAIQLFKNKTVWHNIIKNAMQTDFSWRRSARRYVELYERVTGGTPDRYDVQDRDAASDDDHAFLEGIEFGVNVDDVL